MEKFPIVRDVTAPPQGDTYGLDEQAAQALAEAPEESRSCFWGCVRDLLLAIAGGVILGLIVWSTVQITLWHYKSSCEPLMSEDKQSTWLECDKDSGGHPKNPAFYQNGR